MASTVSIINLALRRLGASSITDISDPTTEAGIASDTFSDIRDSLLREHVWNFATRRTSLAASATSPAWGFERAFPIPSDFLRLLEVNGSHDYDVKVESMAGIGRVFVTDLEAPLYISYIFAVTDADQMDPSFRRALSLRCAMEWAQKLTGSTSLTEQIAVEYRVALQDARTADGQEDTPSVFLPDAWIRART